MRSSTGRFLAGSTPWNKGRSGLQVAWNKGKPSPFRREKHPRWKEDIGYIALHNWLNKNYKKPPQCNRCGAKNTRLEWANISGRYTRDIQDYLALCKTCHVKQDRRTHCHKGHKYTKENTYTNNRGHRRCIACWEARSRGA